MAVPANITIDYSERPGSPVEELTFSDGIRVIRTLRCAYEDRMTLARQLNGYVESGVLHLAHKYEPRFSDVDLDYVYCQSVTIDPFEGLSKSGVTNGWYKYAKLTVNYGTIDRNEVGTTYVTETLQPASEFLTLDRTLYWDSGQAEAVESSQSPGILISMTEWQYTVHGLEIPPAAVIDLPGKVNVATVYSEALDYTFPAGTLLCGNPTMTRQFTTFGTTSWTVTFRFMYRRYGWQFIPRPDGSGGVEFVRLYDSGGNTVPLYETGDFSVIVP